MIISNELYFYKKSIFMVISWFFYGYFMIIKQSNLNLYAV